MPFVEPLVELICFASCPHVGLPRAALRIALERTGRAPVWQEWDQTAPEVPAHAHGLGSPTILIDGRDVTGASTRITGRACRIDDRRRVSLGIQDKTRRTMCGLEPDYLRPEIDVLNPESTDLLLASTGEEECCDDRIGERHLRLVRFRRVGRGGPYQSRRARHLEKVGL